MKFVLSQGNVIASVNRCMIRNDSIKCVEMVHIDACIAIRADGKDIAMYEDERDAVLAYKLLGLWLSEADSGLLRKALSDMAYGEYGNNIFVMPTIEDMKTFNRT